MYRRAKTLNASVTLTNSEWYRARRCDSTFTRSSDRSRYSCRSPWAHDTFFFCTWPITCASLVAYFCDTQGQTVSVKPDNGARRSKSYRTLRSLAVPCTTQRPPSMATLYANSNQSFSLTSPMHQPSPASWPWHLFSVTLAIFAITIWYNRGNLFAFGVRPPQCRVWGYPDLVTHTVDIDVCLSIWLLFTAFELFSRKSRWTILADARRDTTQMLIDVYFYRN